MARRRHPDDVVDADPDDDDDDADADADAAVAEPPRPPPVTMMMVRNSSRDVGRRRNERDMDEAGDEEGAFIIYCGRG